MKKKSIHVPPFPKLVWDDYFWKGEIIIEAWKGFQSRLGPYTSISSEEPSNGLVKLKVATDNDQPKEPTKEQISAFEYLFQYGNELRDVILDRFLIEHPSWLSLIYDEYPELEEYDEEGESVHAIKSAEEFKSLLGLGTIHFSSTNYDGGAYYGFEFGCNWEEEHGLGVLMHFGRIVEVGQADVSFTDWIAEEDIEQQRSVLTS